MEIDSSHSFDHISVILNFTSTTVDKKTQKGLVNDLTILCDKDVVGLLDCS